MFVQTLIDADVNSSQLGEALPEDPRLLLGRAQPVIPPNLYCQ